MLAKRAARKGRALPCRHPRPRHGIAWDHPAGRADLFLLGSIPAWPHSRGWGYGPSGLVGFLLVVLIILLLVGIV